MKTQYNGPIINNTSRNFTTRDSLGIEGVANTISADLCPIVNTVTPRPYYWAFITWCYWKFYEIYGYVEDAEVRSFIKKTNYFVAAGSYLAGSNMVGGFTGITNIAARIDDSDNYLKYDVSYISGNRSAIGGMGYYPPGLQSMGLVIIQREDTGERYSKPHITPKGVKLAEAFDSVISKTEYYLNYLLEESVPKTVLVELGEKIRIDLSGFSECKKLLEQYLFDFKPYINLAKCKDFILYIQKTTGAEISSVERCRRVFFDEFSARGKNKPISDYLSNTAKGWEIVAARQYFTVGLEIIWQEMLQQIAVFPLTKAEWIEQVLINQSFSFSIDQPLSSVIDKYRCNSAEMEEILNEERYNNKNNSLEHGLIIILSVYNRLIDRKDFPEEIKEYLRIGGQDSVSLKTFFERVGEHKQKTIKEFLSFLMLHFLVDQHIKTAFSKMLDDRDGFYLEEINGKYLMSHEFGWGFQGNRMVQLFNVMKDLEVI